MFATAMKPLRNAAGSWTQHNIAKSPLHRISNWTSSERSTKIYWVTWSLPHASFFNLAYIKTFHPPENKTHAILQNIDMFPPSTISYQGVSWNILELTNRVRISSLQSWTPLIQISAIRFTVSAGRPYVWENPDWLWNDHTRYTV